MIRPTFVAFDVAHDGKRSELRLELGQWGDWVQRSVWLLLPTSRSDASAIAVESAEIIDPGDRLFLLRPCLRCLADVQIRSAAKSETSDVPASGVVGKVVG